AGEQGCPQRMRHLGAAEAQRSAGLQDDRKSQELHERVRNCPRRRRSLPSRLWLITGPLRLLGSPLKRGTSNRSYSSPTRPCFGPPSLATEIVNGRASGAFFGRWYRSRFSSSPRRRLSLLRCPQRPPRSRSSSATGC